MTRTHSGREGYTHGEHTVHVGYDGIGVVWLGPELAVAARDLAVSAVPVVVVVQRAVVDHGRDERVFMLCNGRRGGQHCQPTHPQPGHWGRGGERGKGTHIMRAIVVAVCVKEDAKSSEVVSRTKHRPWASGETKGGAHEPTRTLQMCTTHLLCPCLWCTRMKSHPQRAGPLSRVLQSGQQAPSCGNGQAAAEVVGSRDGETK